MTVTLVVSPLRLAPISTHGVEEDVGPRPRQGLPQDVWRIRNVISVGTSGVVDRVNV